MTKVVLSATAERDLIEVWRYVSVDNESAADRLIDRIEQACRLLAGEPGLGALRAELGVGLRSWCMGRYVVIYRSAAVGIEVVRVLHGARDLPSLFGVVVEDGRGSGYGSGSAHDRDRRLRGSPPVTLSPLPT
ncbi:MAG: type II toxin-antitoxin system RelE/ParE family toxin [Planctomycetota bacterium]